jgi:hypothetical protein
MTTMDVPLQIASGFALAMAEGADPDFAGEPS